MCRAFVRLDNELYKMQGTYKKIRKKWTRLFKRPFLTRHRCEILVWMYLYQQLNFNCNMLGCNTTFIKDTRFFYGNIKDKISHGLI